MTYETPPEKLDSIATIAAEVVDSVKGCKLVRCTMTAFNSSSIDFALLYDGKSIDQDRLADDRHQIMIGLIRRFAADGIDFAYPVQIGYAAALSGNRAAQAEAPPTKRKT